MWSVSASWCNGLQDEGPLRIVEEQLEAAKETAAEQAIWTATAAKCGNSINVNNRCFSGESTDSEGLRASGHDSSLVAVCAACRVRRG